MELTGSRPPLPPGRVSPELYKRQLAFDGKDAAADQRHEKLRPDRNSHDDGGNRFTVGYRLLENRENECVEDPEHHAGPQPGARPLPHTEDDHDNRQDEKRWRPLNSVQGKMERKRHKKADAIDPQTPEFNSHIRANRIRGSSLVCHTRTQRLSRRKLCHKLDALQRLHVGAGIKLLIRQHSEIGKIALYELPHETANIHRRKYDGRQTMGSDIADDVFHRRDQLPMQVGRQGQIGRAACLSHCSTHRIFNFL